MKIVTVNTLGIEYPVKMFDSTEEYNAAAPKRSNAVLDDANDSLWYRGGASTARETLYNGILQAKGLERPTTTVRSASGDREVSVPATRANILAALGDEPIESYAFILEDWAKTYEPDPSEAERSSASVVTKGVENALKKIVASGAVAAAATKLSAALGITVDATEAGVKSALVALDGKRRETERAAKKAAQEQFNAALGM